MSSLPPKAVALIPAWNAEAFIQKTLECFSAQTYPNLEVLVSVDLSDDRTADICLAHARKDERFNVFVQTERQGWIGNVNTLLAKAEGRYFMLAFHDDIVAPAYIETLIKKLEANPEAVLAYSDVRAHFPNGDIDERSYKEIDGVQSARRRGAMIIRQKGCWTALNHGVFKSSAAERIGGHAIHRSGDFGADWPWLLHMALLGEFVRAPGFLCDKYYKENSVSRRWDWALSDYLGAVEQCGKEVLASPISVFNKALLLSEVGAKYLKLVLRFGWRRLGRRRAPETS